MNIVVAPDSFKGSMSAMEAAENIEIGIKKILANPKIEKIPMADGGEGTIQALIDSRNGIIIKSLVTGPLGKKIESHFGLIEQEKIAVVEMAAASGLPLVSKEKLDPTITTTYGTGELISKALDYDINKLIIGIGGSATNDAGVGMAQALGVSFLDKNGNEIGYGGKELDKIENIDMSGLDPRLNNLEIEVACDVNNPLFGPNGAAYVYAPQKGAAKKEVELLDNKLRYFNEKIKEIFKLDLQSIAGSGAAGGLGAGLKVFLDARLKSGIEIVLEVNKVEAKIANADLVITGEGKLDGQTLQGKTPIGVAKCAKKYNIPVVAIVGEIGVDVEKVLKEEIDCVFSIIQKACSLEEAMESSKKWIQFSAEQIIRLTNMWM
ncbi:Glycerate kinase [Halanaerobium saccharolyticum subsp. saccharolyticum DSM 6643]|uniref:Glycerate kinase n=1 Tax=Halanaerobium saccharolyticum subsp. saccharolyticum DSM 6643 TaxID=1293054 RepID=M5E1M0_9FIRM|nr:glycerate kinase [Halanaerobium saccharolyticum]CCU79839.1 Glycerate kinase [Halanaerobium saccharolyticum subsp. saccharolyticum DSM 6643]